MFNRVEHPYHYIYTLCLIIEADFNDSDLHRNSSTTRMCLTRLFTFDGCPSALASSLEDFLASVKDSVSITKGSRKATIQIVSVQVVDQNKTPYTKEEIEEIDRKLDEEMRALDLC